MNREDTKQAIEVMQAYVDGAEIEYRKTAGDWAPLPNPNWALPFGEYRIKPKEPREFWLHPSHKQDYWRAENDSIYTNQGYIKVREVIE